jgi:hypothetical protein
MGFTIQEIIQSLRENKYEFVDKYSSKTLEYTLGEIVDEIIVLKISQEFIDNDHGARDGIYLNNEKEIYIVIDRERGISLSEKKFTNIKTALQCKLETFFKANVIKFKNS